jgi:mannose/cellobiose epimerase-like protein (N-acyl-D-glucosamine 2-epimerase family)
MMDIASLHPQYRELLRDGIVPFWARHGLDAGHGGVLSCMQEDGQIHLVTGAVGVGLLGALQPH